MPLRTSWICLEKGRCHGERDGPSWGWGKEEEMLDVGSSQGSWSTFRGQCFSSVVDYGISSDLVRHGNVRENVTDRGHFTEVWVTGVQWGGVDPGYLGRRKKLRGWSALILEEGEDSAQVWYRGMTRSNWVLRKAAMTIVVLANSTSHHRK